MFIWKKLGNVFNPRLHPGREWMEEYAQCPTPFALDETTLRVYIACRPKRGPDLQYLSYPAYVDLARCDPTRVIRLSAEPLLQLGNPGAFDEFGVMPCSVVRAGGGIYMYYTGWTRMSSVPFTVGIGIAVSDDGGSTFHRIGEGPVLGLTVNEPYLVNSPVVRIIDGQWHMWYMTGKKWLVHERKPEAVFQIAHATSSDGIRWKRNGISIIPTKSQDECHDVFLPFFLKDKWHAVFAYRKPVGFRTDRSSAYRIGYASSHDLATWNRDDSHAGIDVSDSGWDSEMMSSCQVIELDGRILLFYCGNMFGREGFGIAELTRYVQS